MHEQFQRTDGRCLEVTRQFGLLDYQGIGVIHTVTSGARHDLLFPIRFVAIPLEGAAATGDRLLSRVESQVDLFGAAILVMLETNAPGMNHPEVTRRGAVVPDESRSVT